MLKKGDFIIYILCLVITATSFLYALSVNSAGHYIIIKQNNQIVYKNSLYINKNVNLKGNKIEIKDGKARVIEANCKNQICVNHKPISSKGESIICLPNRVIITIE